MEGTRPETNDRVFRVRLRMLPPPPRANTGPRAVKRVDVGQGVIQWRSNDVLGRCTIDGFSMNMNRLFHLTDSGGWLWALTDG